MLIFDPQGLLSCAHLASLFLGALKSGDVSTLYLLSLFWSFSLPSLLPCILYKSSMWISLGLFWMLYWVLTDSGLAMSYSPLFGDTCVPKRVKPNGFCYSVPEVICVFFLSDVPFIFFCFLLILCWFGAWDWRVKGNYLIGSAFLTTAQAFYLKWN